ncbi:1-acyl-sn-glycerol-3-phosphate acyltransferases [Sanguibacter gelidistatuariae]|uniref:1-acyl-sn-glycerol-3-phosphate acyltransferases n=1 Tax=Sanguibacter gelidistatuariae TaxID=1814289 RepID=A0A1G6XH58_9MICO|nr:lysophospholipid acyltransferase family protein [Sanguibacter gelidistatuariae]SDD76665.1 1-acyl-sn-glycerol-3-phosphate acyltransferases [Sanguibacter gelidistatuariae]
MSARRRVGIPRGPNVAGALRRGMWRQLFTAVGGYRVRGSAPYEAMVIVANHSSHADTPALIAAFPSPYKPVVVAADDYWYSDVWHRALLRIAIGAVPVSRSGGAYDGLVDGAQQVLGTGSSLLIFPEGTRSLDGELGDFHTGALRIAKEFDVPLLPVALVGTQALLPKNGKFTAGPIEVRLGEPIQPEDLTDGDMSPVIDQITDLLARGEASAADDAAWIALHRLMDSKAGMAAAAAWGFAEAISWPVTAEMFLAVFGAAHPRKVLPAAGWLAVGSVAGVIFTAVCARHDRTPPAPLTTAAMRTTVADHMTVGAAGIWRQALNGIPVKLYAAEAGRRHIPIAPLAAHAIGARGARALALGAVVAVVSHKAQPLLRRAYRSYLATAGVGYTAGLSLVIRRWR